MTMNKTNMDQAILAMENVESENRIFDMSVFGYPPSEQTKDILNKTPFACGMAGCLAGILYYDRRIVGFGMQTDGTRCGPTLKRFGHNNGKLIKYLAKWFGLKRKLTKELCLSPAPYGVRYLEDVLACDVRNKLMQIRWEQ